MWELFLPHPVLYVSINLQCKCVIPVNSETWAARRPATLPLALLLGYVS